MPSNFRGLLFRQTCKKLTLLIFFDRISFLKPIFLFWPCSKRLILEKYVPKFHVKSVCQMSKIHFLVPKLVLFKFQLRKIATFSGGHLQSIFLLPFLSNHWLLNRFKLKKSRQMATREDQGYIKILAGHKSRRTQAGATANSLVLRTNQGQTE